jgi:Fe-S cluster assembly protein SufD
MQELQALENLKAHIPTRKNESYKYTNLKSTFENFKSFDYSKKEYDLDSLRVSGAINLFMLSGELSKESDQSPFEYKQQIETIQADIFKNDFIYQANQINKVSHSFKLPKNVEITQPVFLFHIVSNADTHIFNQESFFQIGESSKVKLVEVFINSDSNKVFFNHSSKSKLENNSKFLHVHHQVLNFDSVFGNSINASVARDADYKSFTSTLGSSLSRTNIHLDIDEKGAEATASGYYNLQGTQHADVSSYISHNAPHTESFQLYKGIMNDKSRGVFTGLIKVQRDAQLINSHQLNRNLLLTKGAHANSRPQLEIFADDVKCAHGSTTGQLSEAELFYFQSRGIRVEKAKMMLARAFTYDVLLKIEDQLIRDYLHNDITEKFEKKAFS